VIAEKAQYTSFDKVRVLQRKLYLSAKEKPSKRYGILYDKIFRMDILREAWCKVRDNRGSAGIDKVKIETIEDFGVSKYLRRLQEELKEETYSPKSIRRVYIPKDPSRTKMRPLGIPVVKDRIVQAAVKIVIEPILEADFQDCSYGFRPKRKPHDAIRMVRRHIVNGYTNVIDADLKSYFDTIPHDNLMKVIKERISDPKIIRMIRGWLEAGIMEDEEITFTAEGTPQGGVISPILANAYLNLLDRNWNELGWSNKAKLVRFADDYVILTKGDPRPWYEKMRKLIERLELTLNEEKTEVVKAEDGFNFLGMHFRRKQSRKSKMWCYIWPSQKAMKKIRHKIKGVTNRDYTPTVEEIVSKINRKLIGWGNYFCFSNCAEHLIKLDNYVKQRIRIWLRRKHQKRGHGYRDYHVHFFERIKLYQLSGQVKRLPF